MSEADKLIGDRESGCKSFVKKICKKMFPYGSRTEFKEQITIAWPIALTQLLQYFVLVVSLSFCGHLGKKILDATALATTIINVVGNSVIYGLACACDTLFSQTYGSIKKSRLGIIAQQSFFILMLGCIPCWTVMINTETLLVLAGQDPVVSKLAGQYTLVYVAALPGIVLFTILSKYLQAQSVVIPSFVIGILANLANAGLHAIFIYVLKLGIYGAALSVSLIQWVYVGLHVIYIWASGIYKGTWPGWTTECLYDWGKFVSLALPGLLMVCLEWWSYEILVFVIGTIDITKLAAHVIVYNLAAVVFMIPLGLSVAASVRVGNHLGACNAEKALTASRVAIVLTVCTSLAICVVLLIFQYYIPMAFSNESDVLEMARGLMLQLAIFVFFDCVQGTCSGVVRGIGLQKFGAINNFIVFYFIALPIALVLLLLTPLSISGVWYGMNIGTFTQTCVFIIRILVTNWEKESLKAQIRTGTADKPEQNSDETVYIKADDDHFTGSSVELVKSQKCNGKNNNVMVKDFGVNVGKASLKGTVLLRLLIIGLFLMGLVGSILVRVYVEVPKVETIDCLTIHQENINKTYVVQLAEGGYQNFTCLSAFERNVLNVTYFYESNHNWNQSFVFCAEINEIRDEVLEITWPEYTGPGTLNHTDADG